MCSFTCLLAKKQTKQNKKIIVIGQKLVSFQKCNVFIKTVIYILILYYVFILFYERIKMNI